MREIRLSGSEGGGFELNRLSLPLSKPLHAFLFTVASRSLMGIFGECLLLGAGLLNLSPRNAAMIM